MRSLQRMLAILEVAASNPDGATVAEIAESTGLPFSTASRLVNSLRGTQLLQSRGGNSYVIGSRIIQLARHGLEQNDIAVRARPFMVKVKELTGETVSLHVPFEDVRVCIAEVRSSHAICRALPVGEIKPIVGTATGEALLAGHSDAELDLFLESLGIGKPEVRSVRERVVEVREQGWSFVDTWTEGVSALSVPIWEGQRVAAALTISGPSFRYSREVALAHLEDALDAARGISRRRSTVSEKEQEHGT